MPKQNPLKKNKHNTLQKKTWQNKTKPFAKKKEAKHIEKNIEKC